MLLKLVVIFIGGGLGTICRFLVTNLSKTFFVTSLYGTLFVNIIGCFLIGFLSGYLINNFSPNFRQFVLVGFLGGLTTFSTLNLEVFEALRGGKVFYATMYMFLSCFLGLLATFLGYYLNCEVGK